MKVLKEVDLKNNLESNLDVDLNTKKEVLNENIADYESENVDNVTTNDDIYNGNDNAFNSEKPEKTEEFFENKEPVIDDDIEKLENIESEITAQEKKLNKIFSKAVVNLASEGDASLKMFVLGKFDEATKQKFSASEKAKNDIIDMWSEIMTIKNVTKDPSQSLILSVLVAIVPGWIDILQLNSEKKRLEKAALKKQTSERPSTSLPRPLNSFTPMNYQAHKTKEKRGRTKGSRKNPTTGKMEMPKFVNGVKLYSWEV